jgi:predicted RNA methylase
MNSRLIAMNSKRLLVLLSPLCAGAPALALQDFGAQQVITTAADGARSVYAVDLDGDGDADVLSASDLDDKIEWYENQDGDVFGTQTQQVITTAADAASSVYAVDLDGDGDADVLSASYNDDKIAWYENQGSAGFGQVFGAQQVITTAADGARSVYAVDLDGDGDADVLSASDLDNKIAWYENQGGGAFGAQQVITTAAVGAESVYAVDLDGDGDADVLSASRFDDKIAWYENQGGGAFGTQQVITTAANGAYSVYAVDLDGDGDADVLSASVVDDKIAWYRNQGGGAFGPSQVITTAADAASSVYAVDLDGDGDADVLSASQFDNKIAWYENFGGGVFGAQQVITTAANGAYSVYAVDLDGDGDADVLSASRFDDKIAWYENIDPDCNDNGVNDVDEIAADPSLDCNANGNLDSCDIASGSSLDQDGNGIPDDCLTPLLATDVTELPGLDGGTQNFTLTAGQDFGFKFYVLLGTLSGTSPGFPIGSMTLPLNFDPYFSLTLQQPNSGAFVDTFGVLSFSGKATSSLIVPPGAQFPGLIGLTFHHAYLVFQPDLTVTLVSNAVELKLN